MRTAVAEVHAPDFTTRLKHDALRRSFTVWRRLRAAGGAAPPWNRFDPIQAAADLNDLEIHERTSAGRLVARQAWSPATRRFRRSFRGLHFDESLGPRAYEARRRMFVACLDSGMPLAYRDVRVSPNEQPRILMRLLLPFRDDSDLPNVVLTHVVSVAESVARPPSDPMRADVVYCGASDLAD